MFDDKTSEFSVAGGTFGRGFEFKACEALGTAVLARTAAFGTDCVAKKVTGCVVLRKEVT